MKKTFLISLAIIILSAFSFAALAWVEPSDSPAAGNVPAPLHQGAEAQTKLGSLTISGDTSATIKGLMVGGDGNNGSNALILQNATQNLIYGNVDATSQGNLLNLQVEGTTKFIIDKDGKVGIGTANPRTESSGSLHIKTVGGGALMLEGAADKNGSILMMEHTGAISPTNIHWAHSIRANNKDYLVFGYDGTIFKDFLRFKWDTGDSIFEVGKVGIGTINPDAQLDVADIYSAGGKNLLLGDDTFLSDIDVANTLGIYGYQDSSTGAIKLGSNGGTITGVSGGISMNSSMSLPIITKTSEYTLTSSDYTVIGDTSVSGVDFNLPSAVGITGRIYVIKRIGANSVVIYPNGSETIDGESLGLELESNYEVVTIQSNGANWIELSHY